MTLPLSTPKPVSPPPADSYANLDTVTHLYVAFAPATARFDSELKHGLHRRTIKELAKASRVGHGNGCGGL